MCPSLAAIVTSEHDDPVIRSEAEHLGATFVAMPISREEIGAAIVRTALRVAAPAGTPPEPIRPPFERRHGERRSAATGDITRDRRLANRRWDTADVLRHLAAGS